MNRTHNGVKGSKQYNTIHTMQYITIQYIQYNAIHYNTIQYIQCNTLQYNTYNTMQYITTECNTNFICHFCFHLYKNLYISYIQGVNSGEAAVKKPQGLLVTAASFVDYLSVA